MSSKPEALTPEIVLFPDIENKIQEAKDGIIKSAFDGKQSIQLLRDTYLTIEINDVSTLKIAEDGVKKMRKFAKSMNEKRLEFTRPIDKFKADIKTFADENINNVNEICNSVEGKIKVFNDKIEAERMKLHNERRDQLLALGWTLDGSSFVLNFFSFESKKLAELSDEEFKMYVSEGEKEKQRKEAEALRREQEKKAIEDAKAEAEAAKLELEKLRNEIARERAELEAQKAALDKTYDVVENPPQGVETPQGVEQPEQVHEQPEQVDEPTPPVLVNVFDVVDTSVKPSNSDYMDGFNEFRKRMLERMNSSEPLTRVSLIEWVSLQMP